LKLHDSLIGAILLCLALVVIWHVRGFPDVPGQTHGAALFPGLAAAGLAISSAILMVNGLRRPANRPVDEPAEPKRLLPLALTAGSVAFYAVASPVLGFLICGILILAVLMAAYGVALRWLVPISVVATLAIHTGFYRVLKVPLPWGVLQPVAW
jgi:putative tricarboxylic transport membrane protein